MSLTFDQANIEASPEQHDQEAVPEGSTESDCEQIKAALSTWQAPSGPLLDIGCGTGRHIRRLAQDGFQITGLDVDPRMTALAKQDLPANCQVITGDAAQCDLQQEFAAAFLLNRGLVCFHSHRLAHGLFTGVARHLRAGGLFLIDNCCCYLWDQIRQGMLADGLSAAGDEQLFFLPGENRFVWRRGDQVNVDSWSVEADDRIYRAWSLGEVALAAASAGLALAHLEADSPLIVLRKPEA